MPDEREASHNVHAGLSSSAASVSVIGCSMDGIGTHVFKTWKDVVREFRSRGGYESGQRSTKAQIGLEQNLLPRQAPLYFFFPVINIFVETFEQHANCWQQ